MLFLSQSPSRQAPSPPSESSEDERFTSGDKEITSLSSPSSASALSDEQLSPDMFVSPSRGSSLSRRAVEATVRTKTSPTFDLDQFLAASDEEVERLYFSRFGSTPHTASRRTTALQGSSVRTHVSETSRHSPMKSILTCARGGAPLLADTSTEDDDDDDDVSDDTPARGSPRSRVSAGAGGSWPREPPDDAHAAHRVAAPRGRGGEPAESVFSEIASIEARIQHLRREEREEVRRSILLQDSITPPQPRSRPVGHTVSAAVRRSRESSGADSEESLLALCLRPPPPLELSASGPAAPLLSHAASLQLGRRPATEIRRIAEEPEDVVVEISSTSSGDEGVDEPWADAPPPSHTTDPRAARPLRPTPTAASPPPGEHVERSLDFASAAAQPVGADVTRVRPTAAAAAAAAAAAYTADRHRPTRHTRRADSSFDNTPSPPAEAALRWLDGERPGAELRTPPAADASGNAVSRDAPSPFLSLSPFLHDSATATGTTAEVELEPGNVVQVRIPPGASADDVALSFMRAHHLADADGMAFTVLRDFFRQHTTEAVVRSETEGPTGRGSRAAAARPPPSHSSVKVQDDDKWGRKTLERSASGRDTRLARSADRGESARDTLKTARPPEYSRAGSRAANEDATAAVRPLPAVSSTAVLPTSSSASTPATGVNDGGSQERSRSGESPLTRSTRASRLRAAAIEGKLRQQSADSKVHAGVPVLDMYSTPLPDDGVDTLAGVRRRASSARAAKPAAFRPRSASAGPRRAGASQSKEGQATGPVPRPRSLTPTHARSTRRLSSEEREVVEHCSFKPKISKRSETLFTALQEKIAPALAALSSPKKSAPVVGGPRGGSYRVPRTPLSSSHEPSVDHPRPNPEPPLAKGKARLAVLDTPQRPSSATARSQTKHSSDCARAEHRHRRSPSGAFVKNLHAFDTDLSRSPFMGR